MVHTFHTVSLTRYIVLRRCESSENNPSDFMRLPWGSRHFLKHQASAAISGLLTAPCGEIAGAECLAWVLHVQNMEFVFSGHQTWNVATQEHNQICSPVGCYRETSSQWIPTHFLLISPWNCCDTFQKTMVWSFQNVTKAEFQDWPHNQRIFISHHDRITRPSGFQLGSFQPGLRRAKRWRRKALPGDLLPQLPGPNEAVWVKWRSWSDWVVWWDMVSYVHSEDSHLYKFIWYIYTSPSCSLIRISKMRVLEPRSGVEALPWGHAKSMGGHGPLWSAAYALEVRKFGAPLRGQGFDGESRPSMGYWGDDRIWQGQAGEVPHQICPHGMALSQNLSNRFSDWWSSLEDFGFCHCTPSSTSANPSLNGSSCPPSASRLNWQSQWPHSLLTSKSSGEDVRVLHFVQNWDHSSNMFKHVKAEEIDSGLHVICSCKEITYHVQSKHGKLHTLYIKLIGKQFFGATPLLWPGYCCQNGANQQQSSEHINENLSMYKRSKLKI